MKISGRLGRHGRISLRFDAVEVELLHQLLDDLDGVLEATSASQSGSDSAVLERLYPSAYRDDDRAEAEFRSLTESSLHTERSERIEDCRSDLAATTARGRSAEIDIADAAVARRWLQVLNDLRLTHGTRLNITEDDDGDGAFDPSDPAQRPKLVYYWLTAVQDSVVRARMR